MLTRRLAVLAFLLLVLPAAFTALFLARHARPAVEPAAQPGGRVVGRLVPVGSPGPLADVAVELLGVARDGAERLLERGLTDDGGRCTFEAPPLDGHYVLSLPPGEWIPARVPFSLAAGTRGDVELPVRRAAVLELDFEQRSGLGLHGGTFTIRGEAGRSWFSPWRSTQYERSGEFEGASMRAPGLPPGRATITVRLAGGASTELVVDLAPGPNRGRIEL
ncbi:MAG: hypothetical protein JNK02_03290 [Planctomycetes bacterium]|nr:hypothetical protein [Planctomycetota bacterium]